MRRIFLPAEALPVLAEIGPGATVRDVAEALYVSLPTARRMLADLVAEGSVRRSRHRLGARPGVVAYRFTLTRPEAVS